MQKDLVALMRLAIPIAFVQVGLALMGFVDTAMAGRMDELSLGAAGLGNSIFFVISIIGLGIVLGTDPLASQAFGAGRERDARRAMWQGLYVAGFASVPLCVGMVLLALG